MSIIAPYHKLLKETALIVCMEMYLESWKYVFEALARAIQVHDFFFFPVHLGVLPPQYQKAGYATARTPNCFNDPVFDSDRTKSSVVIVILQWQRLWECMIQSGPRPFFVDLNFISYTDIIMTNFYLY